MDIGISVIFKRKYKIYILVRKAIIAIVNQGLALASRPSLSIVAFLLIFSSSQSNASQEVNYGSGTAVKMQE